MPKMPDDLPENDRALAAAAMAGRTWSPMGGENPKPEKLANKDFVATMPVVKASTIRALYLGLWDDVVVDPKGVRVTGAHIVGGLDLSFGTGRGALSLLHCHFDEQVVIRGGRLPALWLSGSHLAKGLYGDGARIDGDLFCRDGFRSSGQVRLLGAQIGGNADFIGATLDGNGGAALSADRMVVMGGLFCRKGFHSIGEVRLLGAQIRGTADFGGATLDGRDGNALSADRMVVTGGLFCRKGFHSIGEVRLLGAQIRGAADFDGATLDGKDGKALSADRMVVTGALFCRDGFHSIREVNLLGAQIRGNASFVGATLDGKGGKALSADGMVVTGGLFCRGGGSKGFHIKGAAILVGARIGGLMDWRPAQWTGRLILSHAVVGQWRDDWGAVGKTEARRPLITLDHFIYGAFLSGSGMKVDSDTRIKWLEAAQGKNFTPGPYRTLARVLRAAGDDRGAAAVGLAKEQARSRHRIATYRKQPGKWGSFFWWVPACWLWFWTSLFNLFVGHGYRPWRGVGWLGGFLALGWLLFSLGAPAIFPTSNAAETEGAVSPPAEPSGGFGMIKPADPVFITENQTRNRGKPDPTSHAIEYKLPPEYTPFSAFWYSFDTLVPLVDLGQERAWSPSPLTAEITKDKVGWALLFYLYFHIIMGWVLTTLTVVALTGLIKRDKEEE